MVKGEKIPLFDNAKLARDFTYVDDIVDGVIKGTFMQYAFFNIELTVFLFTKRLMLRLSARFTTLLEGSLRL